MGRCWSRGRQEDDLRTKGLRQKGQQTETVSRGEGVNSIQMLAGVLILRIWNDGFDRADAAFQTKGKIISLENQNSIYSI